MQYKARQICGLKRKLACLVILCVLCLAILYLMNIEFNASSATSDSGRHASTKANKLVADDTGEKIKPSVQPVEFKCRMFNEFRRLNFLNTSLRYRLCRNTEAYQRQTDGFPMCLLEHPIFYRDMLYTVRKNSDIVSLFDMQNKTIQVFVYKGPDYISNEIRNKGSWERELEHGTLYLARKLQNVTFLDIGSNIGTYSLQAAKLGLPVVSVDANIRNLLRLRLSLEAASLDADLVWNFISPDQSLKYLNFPNTCNVGGATMKFEQNLQDTIPVMPIRSSRLKQLIRTKTVVIKMDIEGGEADFLRTSGRLFTALNVAAVQMEWSATWLRQSDVSYVLGFFTALGYNVWQVPGFRALDTSEVGVWGREIDVMWIRQDYAYLVQKLFN